MLASLVMLSLIFISCAQPSVNTKTKKVQASINIEDLEKNYTSPGMVESSGSAHIILEPKSKIE